LQPFLNPLSAIEEKKLLEKCRDGDRAARHALIEHNLRLVAHIVKKYSASAIPTQDLMSAGTIGLCKAVDTYDMKKGNRLVTYASRCIENEILMLLRQERKTVRETSLYEPLGKDKDGNEMSLIDILEENTEPVEDVLCRHELIEQLPWLLEHVLTPTERRLIALRYGLAGNEPHTQKEVGQLFGISRSYVSRMEKKTLLKLKASYAKGR
jgi:RNA polymerase sporulation-specific sigma factor